MADKNSYPPEHETAADSPESIIGNHLTLDGSHLTLDVIQNRWVYIAKREERNDRCLVS